MPRFRTIPLLALATLSVLGPLRVDAAAGLRFLRESPLSRFTEQDFDLLRSAALVVLDSESSDASQDWANEATGNSGKVTALHGFIATDDRPCKRLKVDARSVEFDGSWNFTVCRNTDGDWKIDPSAKPK